MMAEYTYGKDFAIRTEIDFENCTGKITAVKIKTNADRLRAMSDEELAEKLTWIVPYCGDCPARIGNGEECAKDCKKAWLDWLREEVDYG